MLSAIQEKRRRPWCAPSPGVGGRRLERGRDGLVRLAATGRELPCPRLGVFEELGQSPMHRSATAGVSRLQDTSREEGVREADPRAVDLDDACGDGGGEPCVGADIGGRLGDCDRRMRVGGRREQEVPALVGQRRQPFVDEVVQRVRNGQRPPRLDLRSATLERPDDLDRVERVPPGCLVHLGEQRTWERRAQPLVHDAMKRGGVERTDVEMHRPVAQRAAQLVCQRTRQSGSASQEDPDRLAAQAPAGIGQRRSRCRVEPLDVVDGNEHPAACGQCAKRTQKRHSDCVRIGRRPFDVLEDERARQCRALTSREGLECLVEDDVEQVSEPGERELRLALGRLRLERT